MKLNHVRLLVRDYAAAFRFWRDVIGLPVVFGDEAGGYADFDTGGAILAIFDERAMAAAAATSRGESGRDVAVLVVGVDSVDDTYRRLGERGVQLVGPPTDQPDWGIRVAHFRDPEGNLCEIYRPLSS